MVITITTPMVQNIMMMSSTESFNFSDTPDKQEPISQDLSFEYYELKVCRLSMGNTW
jgi:hypothetical protein